MRRHPAWAHYHLNAMPKTYHEAQVSLPAGKRKGINRVTWPMRMKSPRTPGGNSVIQAPFSFFGPRVKAGAYTVKLTKGGQTLDGITCRLPVSREVRRRAMELRPLRGDRQE